MMVLEPYQVWLNIYMLPKNIMLNLLLRSKRSQKYRRCFRARKEQGYKLHSSRLDDQFRQKKIGKMGLFDLDQVDLGVLADKI